MGRVEKHECIVCQSAMKIKSTDSYLSHYINCLEDDRNVEQGIDIHVACPYQGYGKKVLYFIEECHFLKP